MRQLRKWRDVLIEDLATDPEAAIGFLQAVLADYQIYGDPAALVSALRAAIDAQGGSRSLPSKLEWIHKRFWKCSHARRHRALICL